MRRPVHACWQLRQRKITVVTPAFSITPTAAPTPAWQSGQKGVSDRGIGFSTLSDPLSLKRRMLAELSALTDLAN